VKSYLNVRRADRGYAAERVLPVDLTLSGSRYTTGQQRNAFYLWPDREHTYASPRSGGRRD